MTAITRSSNTSFWQIICLKSMFRYEKKVFSRKRWEKKLSRSWQKSKFLCQPFFSCMQTCDLTCGMCAHRRYCHEINPISLWNDVCTYEMCCMYEMLQWVQSIKLCWPRQRMSFYKWSFYLFIYLFVFISVRLWAFVFGNRLSVLEDACCRLVNDLPKCPFTVLPVE